MTLTLGRAPFGDQRGTFDIDVPERVAYVDTWPRRMRAMFADRVVLDTTRALMLHATGSPPTLLVPSDDIASDIIVSDASERTFAVRVGNRTETHAFRIVDGLTGAAGDAVTGMLEARFDAMDRWFEEDDAVQVHLRDPYHRVDVRASSRHVVVRDGDRLIAESTRPKLLFETGLSPRFYLPFADVHTHLLTPSDTVSHCPYKGAGQHWHLVSDDRTNIVSTDAGWSLPNPFAEAFAAIEHIAFYPELVQIVVDGTQVID